MKLAKAKKLYVVFATNEDYVWVDVCETKGGAVAAARGSWRGPRQDGYQAEVLGPFTVESLRDGLRSAAAKDKP